MENISQLMAPDLPDAVRSLADEAGPKACALALAALADVEGYLAC